MRPLGLAVAAAAALSACAHSAVPRRADIQIVSVSVAPTKADGRAWDALEPLAALLQTVETPMLAGPWELRVLHPFLRVARERLAACSEPDPSGTATLTSDEGSKTVVLSPRHDTHEPVFQAGWRDVKISRGTTIRLEIQDDDLAFSDPIGTVEITYADLAAAARRPDAAVPIHKESQQVRSVSITVRPAAGP